MKKLFFFLFATILFASCGNDLEEVALVRKTYKVTFNVSNFDVDAKPLKAAETHSNLCLYAIYEKESGNLLKMDTAHVSQIEEEVPAGSYYIAIISSPRVVMQKPILEPLNFYTDYFSGSNWIMSGLNNRYSYYEKVSFTAGSANVKKDVVLQPMWSEIDIKVSDAAVCALPEGTNLIQCIVNPFYYGYNLADGVASKSYADRGTSISNTWISDTMFRNGLAVQKVITASKDITIKLVFMRQSESESSTMLGERVIYRGDIEGGKHITFTGKLGDVTTSAAFNVSLTGLTDGGVIPFE